MKLLVLDWPKAMAAINWQDMTGKFVAEKRITIDAAVDAVWQALTDPALVKQYMHGTNMKTSWKVRSPINWTGEWKGKAYEDEGTVLAVGPKKLLKLAKVGASQKRGV